MSGSEVSEKRRGAVEGDRVMVALVTVPDMEAGTRLAGKAVQEGLAACGNVIPGLTSIYRWEGEIHQDSESLIIFKTMESSLADLKMRVLELHPYDVPEFLAFSIADGHLPYLQWVKGEVGEREAS